MENDLNILISLGISEQKAIETLKNENMTKNIRFAVAEVFTVLFVYEHVCTY